MMIKMDNSIFSKQHEEMQNALKKQMEEEKEKRRKGARTVKEFRDKYEKKRFTHKNAGQYVLLELVAKQIAKVDGDTFESKLYGDIELIHLLKTPEDRKAYNAYIAIRQWIMVYSEIAEMIAEATRKSVLPFLEELEKSQTKRDNNTLLTQANLSWHQIDLLNAYNAVIQTIADGTKIPEVTVFEIPDIVTMEEKRKDLVMKFSLEALDHTLINCSFISKHDTEHGLDYFNKYIITGQDTCITLFYAYLHGGIF